jgi:hypothetical protein
MGHSMHATAAGVLGGAAVFSEVAVPGLGSFVELGLGAAVAAVGVAAVLRRADPTVPARHAVVHSVRAAGTFHTPAAPLLGLVCDLIDRRAGAFGRAWISACRVLGRGGLSQPAVEAARFVGALEAAAAQVTPRAALPPSRTRGSSGRPSPSPDCARAA